MKRIHLFEFEDFAWFPHWIRKCLTQYIVAVHGLLDTPQKLAEILDPLIKKTGQKKIIDLCSGSGGPMPSVNEQLKDKFGYQDLQLVLSDLYPNLSVADTINNKEDKISYETTPVNAANVDSNLKGIRTMVCSMHHMRPSVAKAILSNAQADQQPICIYEISDNSFPKWIWWAVLPINFLMVLFVTPLVRPMTWQQIVFTYFIPVLPVFIAWDGAVSNARTYTLEDMDILLSDLRTDEYQWETGSVEGKGGNKLYLRGYPLK